MTTEDESITTLSCPKCKQACDPNANFCSHCRHELSAKPIKPVPAKDAPVHREHQPPNDQAEDVTLMPEPASVCDDQHQDNALICECGKALPVDAKFCLECGLAQEHDEPELQVVAMREGKEIAAATVASEDVIVGTDRKCGLAIHGDRYASRRHARISRAGNMLYIDDLGSDNNTLLRIKRSIALDEGDEIVVGTTLLRIVRR